MAEMTDVETGKANGSAMARRFAWAFGILALVLFAFVLMTGATWRDALKKVTSEKIPTVAYMHWGLWWAAAVNAGLCTALALTSRWWAGSGSQIPNFKSQISRREWVWLLILIAGAGALRWGRMDLSLYNDEAHTFRRYIAGSMKESSKGGGPKWRQVKWEETFFLNQVGNNLMPCSVFGRLCYDSWKGLTGAQDGVVSETAIRLPSLIAGLGSLVVLWLLLRRVLPGTACWWGLGFAILHPWHVRYSTEARGYGLMLLAVVSCLYFIQRALEDGRWRWWLGLSVAQFVSVWSFPGAVYFLIVLNGTLVALLSWRAWRSGNWQPPVAAVVSAVIGGMLTLQLMLPTALQLVAAMKILDSVKGAMGVTWWQDVAMGLLNGMRWTDGDVENPWNLSGSRELGFHAWLKGPLFIGVVACVSGSISLLRRGGVAALLVLVGPFAVVLSWALMIKDGKYLHYWYVIYALPGVLCSLAAFLTEVVSGWRRGLRLALHWLLTLWMCFWVWADGRYLKRSKENFRELLPLARGAAFPEYLKDASAPLFGAVFSDVDVYDPHVKILHDAKDLDDLIGVAKSSNRALYITFGRLGLMQTNEPELLKRLQDPSQFLNAQISYGLEEQQFTHFLVRHRAARTP